MALTALQRLRLNLRDPYREFQESQLGDSSAIHFRLSSYPVKAASQQVYKAGTLQTETTDYTLDDATGKLTFVSAPADGAQVFIRGESSAFSDDELNDILAQCSNDVTQATLHALRLLMADMALRERWRAAGIESDPRGGVLDLEKLYSLWVREQDQSAIDQGGVEEWATEQANY